jgi:NAD(P)-dependent dehydrogenase (short-subunit alcohol dehydrogenase family)
MSSAPSSLSGKIALVTGASRGIGRATALRLAADGARVIAHYGSNQAAADSLVAEIRKAGGRAHAIQTDLASSGAAAVLMDKVDALLRAETGDTRFDILVNNAGIIDYTPHDRISEVAFDRLFAVNVRAPYFITEASLPRLRDGGRIINVSSIVVRHALPMILAYNGTKGAIDVFTRNYALVLGSRSITVNAVAPGAIETDMDPWLQEQSGKDFVHANQALPRVGQPRDIADAIAFLASDDARWITGTVVEASGGWKL